MRIIQIMMGLLFGLFVSSVAVANEAQADGPEAHHAINWIDLSNPETPPLVPMMVNFAVVVGLVFLILRKGLGARIAGRKESLEKALAEAARMQQAAEEALAAANERKDALDLEMARIRKDILESGKGEAARIVAAAEERAKRMDQASSEVVAQELARIAEEIRTEVVEKVMARAAERISEKIDEADQERLANEYVTFVGSSTKVLS